MIGNGMQGLSPAHLDKVSASEWSDARGRPVLALTGACQMAKVVRSSGRRSLGRPEELASAGAGTSENAKTSVVDFFDEESVKQPEWQMR